jgi:diguanylate cyclase (GGDEF)-like protein/PAS domain S-box-containing protein
MPTPTPEQLRLALERCAAEPIHHVGAIQPHGALVAVQDERIAFASANLADFLGVAPEAAIGGSLHGIIGETACQALKQAAGREEATPGTPVLIDLPDGPKTTLAAEIHISGDLRVVEFEPALKGARFEAMMGSVQAVLWGEVTPEGWDGYLQSVTDRMRATTGFDRVMVYRFDHRWDGEVIAESRNARFGSLLGHRFPAADIPAQARALYERTLVRALSDVDAEPVPVLPSRHQDTGAPLDMSLSLLRAMSPVHLQYLRNMGVRATLTVSLLAGGKLWGLIACHHSVPRWVPFSVRGLAGLIGNAFSLHLSEVESARRGRQRSRARDVLLNLTEAVENCEEPGKAVESLRSPILELVAADGAAMAADGQWQRFGDAPPWSLIKHLQQWLSEHRPAANRPYVTDELSAITPKAQMHGTSVAGLLAVPLDEQWRSFLFWFRNEVAQQVRWAGPPAAKQVTLDAGGARLAPRVSFDLWRETVRGRSLPWSEVQVDAAHTLSRTLAQVVFRQALKVTESTYRLLADNASDMVARCDAQGRILFASPASRNLFGLAPKAIVGCNLRDLVVEQNRLDIERAFTTVLGVGDDAQEVTITYRPQPVEPATPPRWHEIRLRCEGAHVLATIRDVTERQGLAIAAAEMRRHNEAILAGAEDGILGIGAQGVVSFANAAAVRLLGLEEGALIGEPVETVVRCLPPPEAHCNPGACTLLQALRRGEGAQGSCAHFLRQDSGENFAAEIVVAPLVEDRMADLAGASGDGAVIVIRDVTEKQRLKRELRQSHAAVENTADAIVTVDRQGRVRGVNAAIQAISGYGRNELIGQPVQQLFGDPGLHREVLRQVRRNGRWSGEVALQCASGTPRPMWGNVVVVTDDRGRTSSFVATLSNLSALRQNTEQLAFAVSHDPFTALPNRQYLEQAFLSRLTAARARGAGLAVVFFDIDQLRLVNDSHGHAMGDAVVQEMAWRLRVALPDGQLLARWGGDEFVAILDDIEGGVQASRRLGRIRAALTPPFALGGLVLLPSVSIGVALSPQDGTHAGSLISRAHSALHRAKQDGGGQIGFFSESSINASRRRLELNWALREAVEKDQLLLHYQPQFDAVDGKLVGLEALLRWQHPADGLLSPAAFLDDAQALGLIPLIGRWVRTAVCEQISAWDPVLPPGVRVAVNVMPEELDLTLSDELLALLERTGVPTTRLEIEVVEGAMDEGEAVPGILADLRRAGVQVAIDDFGTGFSSLARLRDLPIDCLKVDKQFVDGVTRESGDRAVISAIATLGHSLGAVILAEGVENDEQARALRSLGVDRFQGFRFSRPLPPKAVEDLLQAGASAPVAGEGGLQRVGALGGDAQGIP